MVSNVDKIDKIVHQKYSADLFQDQKRKISEIKILNEQISHPEKALILTPSQQKRQSKKEVVEELNKFEIYKNRDLNLTLDDIECWDYSSFDYEILDSEDVPSINSPFWPLEELSGFNKENGIDIRNIILKTVTQFNMHK